jgi:hypothetical protein
MLILQSVSGLGIGVIYPSGSQFYWDRIVAVDDELQQSATTDYSGTTFKAVFFRGS